MAQASGSILAVDLGNVRTRAMLIDLVDGAYKMVARSEVLSTAGYPANDVSLGLLRAAAEISRITGRRLVNRDDKLIRPEQPNRTGVDMLIATASVGRPLRTVLVGLVPDVSIASGIRATDGTYVEVVQSLSLNDTLSDEEQLNTILGSRPDLILITGGTEGGAETVVLQLARVVRMAITLLETAQKPAVIYAGNSVLVPQMRALFRGVTRLLVAPNVRPSLETEEVEAAQLQLALAFDRHQAGLGGGFSVIAEETSLGILPTGQSYDLIVDYLGRAQTNHGVLAVDIGSAVSTLALSLDGKTNTSIRTDIGLGHSAHSLLESVGYESVQRWLPFYATATELETYTLNKTLRPASMPQSIKELYIEYALLRAGVQAMLAISRPAWEHKHDDDQLPPLDLIIGAGAGLTFTGRPAYTAMLLLDALQPTAVTALKSDPYGLVAALGALVHSNPEAVVQLLDGGELQHLGTSVNVSGKPKPGKTALKLKITAPDGQKTEHEVKGGELWVYPLHAGHHAQVEIKVSRGLKVGGKRRLKLDLEGGLLGIIFDARGRPLPLEKDMNKRAQQMPAWLAQITGDEIIPIDERWLQPASDEGKAQVEPKEAKKKPPKERRRRRKKEASKQDEAAPEEVKAIEEETQDEDRDELDLLRDVLS